MFLLSSLRFLRPDSWLAHPMQECRNLCRTFPPKRALWLLMLIPTRNHVTWINIFLCVRCSTRIIVTNYFLSSTAASFHIHLAAVLSLNQFVIITSFVSAYTLSRFRADLYTGGIGALVNMFPQLLHNFIHRWHTLLVIIDHRGI